MQVQGTIPADPIGELRLSDDGVVCGEDGKIDVMAYQDLVAHFAGEPPPDKHPDPAHPGMREGEVLPKGLRIWDDKRSNSTGADKAGAGWIAVFSNKKVGKKEQWFNIRTCGSWRLAFLLARLQRDRWARTGGIGVRSSPRTVEEVATKEKEPGSPSSVITPVKRKEPPPQESEHKQAKRRCQTPTKDPFQDGSCSPALAPEVPATPRRRRILTKRPLNAGDLDALGSVLLPEKASARVPIAAPRGPSDDWGRSKLDTVLERIRARVSANP